MHNWKEGDKARVKYIRRYGDASWKVGTIVTIENLTGGVNHRGTVYDCWVRLSNGILATPLFEQLEPIIKRPLMGNWHNIEVKTGWNPTKEKVNEF